MQTTLQKQTTSTAFKVGDKVLISKSLIEK